MPCTECRVAKRLPLGSVTLFKSETKLARRNTNTLSAAKSTTGKQTPTKREISLKLTLEALWVEGVLQRQQFAVADLLLDALSTPNSLDISPPGAGRRWAHQPEKSVPRKTPVIFRLQLFYPPLAQSSGSVRCPRKSSGEERPRCPSIGPFCARGATLASSKRMRKTGGVAIMCQHQE